jgi:DNA-binding NarL/FixJ family response regulator
VTDARILVCCATPVLCAGLAALLEQRIDPGEGTVTFATETTAAGVVAAAKSTSPDVTLVVSPVLTLTDLAELEVLAALSKVVLVAKAENTHRSIEGLRVGVRAVLPPDCSPEELVNVVTMVAAGDAMVMPGAARDGLARMPGGREATEFAVRVAGILTAREKEVLVLLAQGGSNVEIAEELSVSVPTVRSHVHHLLGKLGVASRGQAIAVAHEFGLVNALRK